MRAEERLFRSFLTGYDLSKILNITVVYGRTRIVPDNPLEGWDKYIQNGAGLDLARLIRIEPDRIVGISRQKMSPAVNFHIKINGIHSAAIENLRIKKSKIREINRRLIRGVHSELCLNKGDVTDAFISKTCKRFRKKTERGFEEIQ